MQRLDFLHSAWFLVLFASCTPRTTPQPDVVGDAPDANTDESPPVVVADDVRVDVPVDGTASTQPCDQLARAATDADVIAQLIRCVSLGTTSDAQAHSAIGEALEIVRNRGGFPVRSGRSVIFVYARDAEFDAEDDARSGDEDFAPDRRLEPLTLAGDFNSWRADANPMQHRGHGLYTVDVPLDILPDVRWAYKFTARTGAGQTVFFSDPQSRRFQYDDNGRISFVTGSPRNGHLEVLHNVRSMRFAMGREVYVYVPPGYEQTEMGRFAVLYMHDGNNLFDAAQPRSAPSSWNIDQTTDSEIAANRIAPCIIVGIENTSERFAEYTHTTDRLNGATVGGAGRDYLQFITQTIKPMIDQRYRTMADREHTAIMGSSLGGLISYYAALEQPMVFSMFGGMSSTFGWGSFGGGTDTMLSRFAMAAMIPKVNTRYFLDSGGGPGAGGSCVGAAADTATDNFCETVAMRDVLVSRGVGTFVQDPNALMVTPPDANIEHFVQMGAPHSEQAWSVRFHRALRFFFGPR